MDLHPASSSVAYAALSALLVASTGCGGGSTQGTSSNGSGGSASSSSSQAASSSSAGAANSSGTSTSTSTSTSASSSGGGGGSASSSTGAGGSGGSGGSATGGSGGMGGAPSVCGDGVIEGSEECDLGAQNGTGMGCSSACTFDCMADADCNTAKDPCTGTATCNAATVQGQSVKQCVPGTPLADGTSCGADLFCVDMNCIHPSCGDGVVEPPEECDDGNTTNGDGCDDTCTFSCVSSDPARDCASTNACVSDGTCDDSSHTCTPGTPASDGTSCGSGQICVGGACTAASCGDGFVTPPEQCDFGAGNNMVGSGCEPNCTFSCTVSPNTCSDGNPCNGLETCNAVTGPNNTIGEQCAPGNQLPDGTSCGGGKICKSGVCSAPAAVCGNGIVEVGEQCDLGAQNGTGVGCSATCHFDCQTTSDCSSSNACVANGTCATGTVNGQTIQKCQAGADAAKCTACTNGLCDGGGNCKPSTCGDGCVDQGAGEQCDPPNGTTCGPTCKLLPICGDGVIQGNEQCDDGNQSDLDGCDSSCNYEVVARMTSIAISGTAAPAALGCTPSTNAFGAKALTTTALNQFNPQLTTAVNNGTVNMMTQFIGLSDLTGVSSTPFTLGVMDGSLDPARGAWPGNNPIDWWFLTDPASVSNGLPIRFFSNVGLSAHNIKGGPANITLNLDLGGSPAALAMLTAHIAAAINGNPPPNVPAPPPAALAAGLTVFETITGNGAGQGLCGNITVSSLAATPVPAAFAAGGNAACLSCGSASHTYTPCTGALTPLDSTCNSLLDVLVGGCESVVCSSFTVAVNPTQPDVPAGATVTTLTLGAGNKVPNATTMNDMDAYSSYLTFTANRAHFTGETCAVSADCETGKTCTGGVCK